MKIVSSCMGVAVLSSPASATTTLGAPGHKRQAVEAVSMACARPACLEKLLPRNREMVQSARAWRDISHATRRLKNCREYGYKDLSYTTTCFSGLQLLAGEAGTREPCSCMNLVRLRTPKEKLESIEDIQDAGQKAERVHCNVLAHLRSSQLLIHHEPDP